jgi:cobalamin biosynthesis protein CobW
LVRAFSWPEIRNRVTVDAVVTVLDGPAISEGRFAHDEIALAAQRAAVTTLDHDNPVEELFADQLNCADMVLVNKSDLLDVADLRRIKADLRQKLRPGTRLLATQKGSIDISALLGLGAEAELDVANRPSHHELEGEAQHDHDDFESFVVPVGLIADRESYLARIPPLIARHDILRLKGFLALSNVPSRLLVQAVGPRLETYFDRPWRIEEAQRGNLVVIGLKGLNREAIAAGLQV